LHLAVRKEELACLKHDQEPDPTARHSARRERGHSEAMNASTRLVKDLAWTRGACCSAASLKISMKFFRASRDDCIGLLQLRGTSLSYTGKTKGKF
jgi:hypothetical protein